MEEEQAGDLVKTSADQQQTIDSSGATMSDAVEIPKLQDETKTTLNPGAWFFAQISLGSDKAISSALAGSAETDSKHQSTLFACVMK